MCEIELRPEGVWAHHMDTQTIYEWKIVEAVEEVDDAVIIFARGGGGLAKGRKEGDGNSRSYANGY